MKQRTTQEMSYRAFLSLIREGKRARVDTQIIDGLLKNPSAYRELAKRWQKAKASIDNRDLKPSIVHVVSGEFSKRQIWWKRTITTYEEKQRDILNQRVRIIRLQTPAIFSK